MNHQHHQLPEAYASWLDFCRSKVKQPMTLQELSDEVAKLQTIDRSAPELLMIHAMLLLEALQSRQPAAPVAAVPEGPLSTADVVSIVAQYVADHCVDGDDHARVILEMAARLTPPASQEQAQPSGTWVNFDLRDIRHTDPCDEAGWVRVDQSGVDNSTTPCPQCGMVGQQHKMGCSYGHPGGAALHAYHATHQSAHQGAQSTPSYAQLSGEVVNQAPERIWLQINTDGSPDDAGYPSDHEGVSWCWHSVGGQEVEYIRADTAPQPAQAARVAIPDPTTPREF